MAFNFNLAKYKNKKVLVNGIEFASQKEATRYWELWLMEQNGYIKDLKTQVKYELIPKQQGKLRNERAVSYIADFVYWDNEKGHEVVEDAKGFKTKEYVIKRKLMKYLKGIEIVEI